MTDLLPVTLEDQIAEVDRELALRRKVYPRWVSSKKLKQDEADRHMSRMEAVLATLVSLKSSPGE